MLTAGSYARIHSVYCGFMVLRPRLMHGGLPLWSAFTNCYRHGYKLLPPAAQGEPNAVAGDTRISRAGDVLRAVVSTARARRVYRSGSLKYPSGQAATAPHADRRHD